MTLEQLRARLTEIKGEMQGLIDAGLSDENQEKFDALEAEGKKVRANIERVERFEKENQADQAGLGRQTQAGKSTPVTVHDNKQDDPTGGFNGLGDFALSVRRSCPQAGGIVDDRLKVFGAPSNFHKEGGSSDGYMVPTEYKDKIVELMFNEPDLLSMVDGEPTNFNSVQFLADESTPWGSTGIQAAWGSEGVQLDPSRLETEGRELKLSKLHAYVLATEELIEDSPRLNRRLTAGSARALNWKANSAIHSGTGAGQLTGFDNGGSKVVVAKESGQTANTIVAKNVAKMFSRSLNPGRSIWFVNQDILPELLTMTLGDKPIYTPPATGFTNAPGGFLFGRPIMFTDHCDTLGSEGDIKFIDPMGYYLLRKNSGVKFSSSIHLFFDYDLQAFKWTTRLGGQPYLRAPVTPNKGSATRSHYVTLATRA